MKNLGPSGSRSPRRFHALGEVAKLVPPSYPCAGSLARIIATSHFSRELPRSGIGEESAARRDRFFLHFPPGLSHQHKPKGPAEHPQWYKPANRGRRHVESISHARRGRGWLGMNQERKHE
jgi:hypothetical protein